MIEEYVKGPEDPRPNNFSNRECQKEHWFVHKQLCTADPSDKKSTSIIDPDGPENLDRVDITCTKVMSIPPRRSDGSPMDSDGTTECIIYAGMRDAIFRTPGFPARVPWPRKPAHTLENIAGVGWGMFATRDIKMGELIYAERPLLLSKVSWTSSRGYDDIEQATKGAFIEAEEKLEETLQRMTPARQEAFRNLYNCHSHEDICPQLVGILRTNGSPAQWELQQCISSLPDHPHGAFKAVGEICSRVNHSAGRDIRAGEEITVKYDDPLQPRAVRQAKLDAYYFVCSCLACTDSVTSDYRRQQIVAVADIDVLDVIPQWINNRALPDDYLEKKALTILGLLEEEGLEISTTYVLCKQLLGMVYAALGDQPRAMKYMKEMILLRERHEDCNGMSVKEHQRSVENRAKDLVKCFWRLRCPNAFGPAPYVRGLYPFKLK
ncbi:hypothetical protein CERSUDRAFT_121094 [Gelatoporia subvermispora B]|uniref:SET domain-containing protein n=1 Tax=Ceriporiopsis subvermispora (strain B) TaxID=914234 RepID=M2RN40_CERS8|nr:hypothetical protein CERSUDRAFT_121094 [Gelatoporia subvermispora B]